MEPKPNDSRIVDPVKRVRREAFRVVLGRPVELTTYSSVSFMALHVLCWPFVGGCGAPCFLDFPFDTVEVEVSWFFVVLLMRWFRSIYSLSWGRVSSPSLDTHVYLKLTALKDGLRMYSNLLLLSCFQIHPRTKALGQLGMSSTLIQSYYVANKSTKSRWVLQ